MEGCRTLKRDGVEAKRCLSCGYREDTHLWSCSECGADETLELSFYLSPEDHMRLDKIFTERYGN